MKTCDEMVNSLLERREQYENERKNRRKMLKRTITPLCFMCLVALLGFGAWQGGIFNTTPPHTADDAIYQGIKDNFDESKGESPNNPAANNKIVINHIDGLSASRLKLNFELKPEDRVEMDKVGLNNYYGINVFPEVPKDIKEWEEDSNYSIYKKNGGTGEVYWDQQVLNYDNEDFSRGVYIELKKGSLPILDYSFGDSTEEKSVINNWEVIIGLSEKGYYHALFMYHEVGFCVNASGLTQDEFVGVLSSIIK